MPTSIARAIDAGAGRAAGVVKVMIDNANDRRVFDHRVRAKLEVEQRLLAQDILGPRERGPVVWVNSYVSYSFLSRVRRSDTPLPTSGSNPAVYVYSMAAVDDRDSDLVRTVQDGIERGFRGSDRVSLTEYFGRIDAPVEQVLFLSKSGPGDSLVGTPKIPSELQRGLQWYTDLLFPSTLGPERSEWRYVHLGLPSLGLLRVGSAGVYLMMRDSASWVRWRSRIVAGYRSFLRELLLGFAVVEERRHARVLMSVFGHHLSGYMKGIDLHAMAASADSRLVREAALLFSVRGVGAACTPLKTDDGTLPAGWVDPKGAELPSLEGRLRDFCEFFWTQDATPLPPNCRAIWVGPNGSCRMAPTDANVRLGLPNLPPLRKLGDPGETDAPTVAVTIGLVELLRNARRYLSENCVRLGEVGGPHVQLRCIDDDNVLTLSLEHRYFKDSYGGSPSISLIVECERLWLNDSDAPIAETTDFRFLRREDGGTWLQATWRYSYRSLLTRAWRKGRAN